MRERGSRFVFLFIILVILVVSISFSSAIEPKLVVKDSVKNVDNPAVSSNTDSSSVESFVDDLGPSLIDSKGEVVREIHSETSAQASQEGEESPTRTMSPEAECGSVPIDGCEITTSTTFNPGSYYLPQGLIIGADNVVLDCNGAQIYSDEFGLPRYGVWIEKFNNITIRNCDFKWYTTGIVAKHMKDLIVRDSNIHDNYDGSIYTENSSYISILNNSLNNNKVFYAVRNYKSYHIFIEGNNVKNNRDSSNMGAFELDHVCNVTVKNNYFENNSRGISIDSYDDYILINGSYWDAGITNLCDFNHLIEGNTFKNNPTKGITIWKVLNDFKDLPTFIMNNTFINHSMGAIFVTKNQNDIKIGGNSFVENKWYALGIYGANTGSWDGATSNNVEFYNNSILGPVTPSTQDHGIYVTPSNSEPSGNNYFHDNNITRVRGGIFLDGNEYTGNNRNVLARNKISNAFLGISEFYSEGDTIKENTLYSNSYGLDFQGEHETPVYLNNVYNNIQRNVRCAWPRELSYNRIGNYWGHASPPCFVVGVDSELAGVVDSYPICAPITSTSVEIPISSYGWHFIGSNLVPDETSVAGTLFSLEGQYEAIRYYLNGNNKEYKPTNPPFLNTLTEIDPWYGYWIKVTDQDPNNLIIVGDKVTGCHSLNLQSDPVNQHWIGYWVNSEVEPEIALSSIDGDYDVVRTQEDGIWKTYDPNLPQFSALDVMKPGRGYLIKMNSAGSLDYICPRDP